MHANAYQFVANVVRSLDQPICGLVVEIGGRNINGSVRELFGEPYLSIDPVDGPGVDVVAHGESFRPPYPAEAVVCCEVLEHAPKASEICRNAYRMLRPGGVFIVTTATDGRAPHSAVDGGGLRAGEFYRNVSEALLRRWLKPFTDVTIAFNHETSDIYATATKARRSRRHSVPQR